METVDPVALMTPTPGAAAECRVCQKAGARNGKLPNKYCDATSCMQVGVDEGHIAHAGKRQRAQSYSRLNPAQAP